MTMKGRTVAILLAALTVAALVPLSAQTQSAWYEAKMLALGFEVFKQPIPMTDFAVTSLAGLPTRLSTFKGKVVLVNFWATWCPPCRKEMPAIEKLWTATKNKDFVIMGISENEPKETVASFLKANPYSWPMFLDAGSRVGAMYGVEGIPTTIVVDKNGNAIARVVGLDPRLDYSSSAVISLFSDLATRDASGK